MKATLFKVHFRFVSEKSIPYMAAKSFFFHCENFYSLHINGIMDPIFRCLVYKKSTLEAQTENINTFFQGGKVN